MNITKIGQELISCRLNCHGIRNEPKRGIVPRGLNFERRNGSNACIVVGLNPGKCKQNEQDHFKDGGIEYTASISFFETIKAIPYFRRIRDFITEHFGFDGHILWTNLAKCECKDQTRNVPVQTFRICIDRFLRKEVEVFQCSTIFAFGNRSFEFCALSFPKHFVIGLPHPTGGFRDFHKLLKKMESRVFKNEVLNEIQNTKDANGNYRAIRLTSKGILK